MGTNCTVEAFRQLVLDKTKPWGKDGTPPWNHAAKALAGEFGPYVRDCFLDPEGHSFSWGDFS